MALGVVEQAWLGFGPQRNFASEQATYDWILVLDADEFLSHLLREECLRRLPELLLDEGREKPLAAIWLRPQYLVHGGTDALVPADGGGALGPCVSSSPRLLD